MAMTLRSFEMKRLASGVAAHMVGLTCLQFLLKLRRTARLSPITTTRRWLLISPVPSLERLVIITNPLFPIMAG